jgi:hypothetical protein
MNILQGEGQVGENPSSLRIFGRTKRMSTERNKWEIMGNGNNK